MNANQLPREEILNRLNARPLLPAIGPFEIDGHPNTAMGSTPLVLTDTYRAYWIYNDGGTVVAATHGLKNAHGHKILIRGVGANIDDCRWAAERHSQAFA